MNRKEKRRETGKDTGREVEKDEETTKSTHWPLILGMYVILIVHSGVF